MTDWEFVFDGVVGFLRSPMWNVPIVTFIEKNCVVFEPSDENELAYTEIHKEYGQLVEELLTSYLQDVGITEDQFVSACEAGSRDNAKVPDRSIFEQVWAGEDFYLFKKIMVKKNLDLELQALHMIQQRNGIVPQVFVSESEKSSTKKSRQRHQTDEETLLKEIMERSRQEFEKEKGKRKEIERMEKTLALSKEESERLHELAERELNELERMVTLSLRLENARGRDETSNAKRETKESSESKTSSQKNKGKPAEVKSSGKPSAKETPEPATTAASKKEVQKSSPQSGAVQPKPSSTKQSSQGLSSPKPKPVTETVIKKESKNAVSTQANPSSPKQRQPESKLPSVKAQRTPAEAAADWILSAKAEVNTSSSKNLTDPNNGEKMPMDDEIMQRANYMRIQREKLLNLKKQERAKRLQTFEDEQPVRRPISSRVAQRITQGSEAEKPATSAVSEQEQKKLAMRRALAERLKKEVINEQFVK